MHVVGLGKNHEFLDGFVLNLVVVRLAAHPEGAFVHVDIETTSVMKRKKKREPVRIKGIPFRHLTRHAPIGRGGGEAGKTE